MVLNPVNTYQFLIILQLTLRTIEIVALVRIIYVYLSVLIIKEAYSFYEKLALANRLHTSHRPLRIDEEFLVVSVISPVFLEEWRGVPVREINTNRGDPAPESF